jgi:hypothetical protein
MEGFFNNEIIARKGDDFFCFLILIVFDRGFLYSGLKAYQSMCR